MSYASLGTARATAAQVDAFVVHRIRQTRPAVIYCHGAGAGVDASQALGVGVDAIRLMLAAVADAGFPVVAFSAEQTFGNTTAQARIIDALAWAQSSLGATADPPFLIGMSMGGCAALRFAAANDCAGVIGLEPVFDLQAIRDGNVMGLRSVIDTAWGVTYPAALPAGADPADDPAALTDVPTQLWYATDDLITTGIDDFATAIGADLHSVGALGHGATAIAAVTIADVLAFITAHTL